MKRYVLGVVILLLSLFPFSAYATDLTPNFQWIKSYVMENGVKGGKVFVEKRRGLVVIEQRKGYTIWMEVEEIPWLEEKENCWVIIGIVEDGDKSGRYLHFDPLAQKYGYSTFNIGNDALYYGKSIKENMLPEETDREAAKWLIAFGFKKN